MLNTVLCRASLAITLLLCCSCKTDSSVAAAMPNGTAGSVSIRVVVKDANTNWGLENARVFVLSMDGKEVASTTTDEDGIALLTVGLTAEPEYVLVEREGYFIGGTRWRETAWEYYIKLAIFTVA